MTKKELIEAVNKGTELNKKESTEAVNAVVDAISGALIAGESFTISGFGTLSVVERAERTGLNPRTGEEIEIPANRTVKFKPGKALKDALNQH